MTPSPRAGGRRPSWAPWFGPALALTLLATWELSVARGWISPLYFPAPSRVGATLASLLSSGELAGHLGLTFQRLAVGFAIGSSIGLVLGLVLGSSRPLRRAVDPCIAALHPVPKISLYPLFLILLGIGEASKVVLVALSTFFPMVINVMGGVRQIHSIHFEVAQNYGAGRLQTFRQVTLPGSLPSIFTGARLALNLALTIAIAAELIAADRGLGALIWFAWETLRTELLFATVFVIALMGVAFNLALQGAFRIFVPWQADTDV